VVTTEDLRTNKTDQEQFQAPSSAAIRPDMLLLFCLLLIHLLPFLLIFFFNSVSTAPQILYMAGQCSELFENLKGRGGELGQGRMRADKGLTVQFARTDPRKNKLPMHVRSATSSESFRKRL
jgi:hypothetical protein